MNSKTCDRLLCVPQAMQVSSVFYALTHLRHAADHSCVSHGTPATVLPQPTFEQSCVPLIATGAIAPRALCPDGFITIIGVSQDVQTSFLPTSIV